MKVLFYRCSKEEVDVILLIMVNFVNWFKIYLVKYCWYFFFLYIDVSGELIEVMNIVSFI